MRLTTDPGDVVLDPFAGTGVVLSEAAKLDCRAIGTEINPDLVENFSDFLASQESPLLLSPQDDVSSADFEDLIKKLRILKFSRLLLRGVRRELNIADGWILALPSERKPEEKYSIISADYFFSPNSPENGLRFLEIASNLARKIPLSKFGIDWNFSILSRDKIDEIKQEGGTYFGYGMENTHKFKCEIEKTDILTCRIPIISSIGVSLDEQAAI